MELDEDSEAVLIFSMIAQTFVGSSLLRHTCTIQFHMLLYLSVVKLVDLFLGWSILMHQ